MNPKPLNRKAELLLFFMENKNQIKSLSYLDIAKELHNNNVHRYRQWLEDEGINFNVTKVFTKNKYGTPIEFKRFKLKSGINDAKKVYERINK